MVINQESLNWGPVSSFFDETKRKCKQKRKRFVRIKTKVKVKDQVSILSNLWAVFLLPLRFSNLDNLKLPNPTVH